MDRRKRATASRQFARRPLVFWCQGVFAYAVLSLVPGTAGKSVVAGWLLGLWPAVAMVEIGLTSAAVVSFFIGRYFARELIQRRVGTVKLRKLARRFRREGAFYLLLLRFGHAPFTLVNYGAGVARIP
ncbi:MAG: VTT domain-containing protein [Pirellulaceae bacterium]